MKYKLTDTQVGKKGQDTRALLALLNEHCHTDIGMTFTRAAGGCANPRQKCFTIPQHAFAKGETYLFYYVIHEFTHCRENNSAHDRCFKQTEQELLGLFGISIDYARAYPKTLYANGERVYSKPRYSQS